MSAVVQSMVAHDAPRVLKAASTLGVMGGGGMSAPRILASLCDATTPMAEVSRLVEMEPGIATRVLRVANSAFYGVSRSVTTVSRALVLLGVDAVRGIAAAACLDRTIMRATDAAMIDRAAFIQHSLATAIASEALARYHFKALAPEAFIAGLIHNIGIPVQALLDPKGVRVAIDALAQEPGADIHALEEKLIQVGHEYCGAIIFEAWNLPESLVAAARHHHRPQNAPPAHRPLACLLHVGLKIAADAGFSFGLEPSAAACCIDAESEGLASSAELESLITQLPDRVAVLRSALSG